MTCILLASFIRTAPSLFFASIRSHKDSCRQTAGRSKPKDSRIYIPALGNSVSAASKTCGHSHSTPYRPLSSVSRRTRQFVRNRFSKQTVAWSMDDGQKPMFTRSRISRGSQVKYAAYLEFIGTTIYFLLKTSTLAVHFCTLWLSTLQLLYY